MIYILFILGFALLIKGADLLVDGASSIAKRNMIPGIVIGLTVVSFGTSAPEFVVSILASHAGNSEIALGNILGSNIVNILLILGVSAAIFPLVTKKNTVWKEIPFALLAVVLIWVMANDQLINGESFSSLSRIDGILLLSFFIIFMYYIASVIKNEKSEDDDIKVLPRAASITYFILGLIGLVIGGKWIVDGAVNIASSFGVSQSLIGLTIVAIGTSLPELATSVIAARKKQTDIAIGNVVGSNIFNVFWILGFSAVVSPIPFSSSDNFNVLVAIFSAVILFIFLFIGNRHKIDRWQGVAMVLIYFLYIAASVLKN